jgi:hypothetical protein
MFFIFFAWLFSHCTDGLCCIQREERKPWTTPTLLSKVIWVISDWSNVV